MVRRISLTETFGEDAAEMREHLQMFGRTDAPAMIVSSGRKVTAEQLKNEGMARSYENAEQAEAGWGDRAYKALMDFVQSHSGPFMAEDVRFWATWIKKAPSERAWGAVMLRAASGKRPIIKKAGYAQTRLNALAHGTPANVWEAI